MSSGFVTEKEAIEARQKRQEEWEKVRKPEEPAERPEEPYDSRTLYDRLKEQKMKKDLEFEETHKLKNLIRGLDDEEVQFLDLVDQSKLKAEKQQLIEEKRELAEFRQRVATLQEQSVENKLQMEIGKPKLKGTVPINNRLSQKSILSGVVIRKRPSSTGIEKNDCPAKKFAAAADEPSTTGFNGVKLSSNVAKALKNNTSAVPDAEESEKESVVIVGEPEPLNKGALECIRILPGIGRYKDSSDSEISSDSDDEPDCHGRYDLVGRKIQRTACGSNN